MGTCCSVDLFLHRHGVTDWNQEKRYLGHSDRGVLKSELMQLSALKEVLENTAFDFVFTSDLRRCQETLAFFTIPCYTCIDPRLREMNFGDWEGKTYEDLKEIQAYRKWISNWELHSPPNGESGNAFKARIDTFIDDLFQHIQDSRQYRILMMTHGGVIRYILTKFHAAASLWELSIEHGQAIQLSLTKQEGEWRCSSLSEVPLREKEK